MRNIISYRTTALVHHRTLQILMFYSKSFKAFIHGNTGGSFLTLKPDLGGSPMYLGNILCIFF